MSQERCATTLKTAAWETSRLDCEKQNQENIFKRRNTPKLLRISLFFIVIY